MPMKFANNAVSKLAGAITTSSTSFSVTPGDGAKFPTLTAGDWFPLTLVKSDGTLEIVRCTARATDVFTITRAQEGTAASAFSSGDRVELRATAAVFDALAELASPAFTGTPTAPTAAANTNTTQVATTGFVLGQAATAAPQALGTAAVGNSTRFARENHVHAMPTLDALTNVTITSNVNGEILRWNGTAWVNNTLAEAGIAPVASPALTGTPTAPTAGDGTNTTQVATTAFVQNAVGGYLAKAVTGGTVTLTDTEASNPVIALTGTLTSALSLVVPTAVKRLWAIYNNTSGAFTVTVKTAAGTGVTVAQGKRNLVYTDGTNVYDGFNDFESVALTGTPTAPTAAANTNTTQVATTAFVLGQAATAAPQALGTAAVGNATRFARENHVHAMPTLDALANTTITSNTTGEILRWNGTAWVNATLAEAGIAPVASPALTGTPTAPTAAAGTNTTQVATTAFVQSAVSTSSTTFASAAENAAGTVQNKAVDPLGIREAFNATGSAPVFACRAWVNFNGTGTVAIRASGNVSSITDNGAGRYTINFTTAMPDVNYAMVATGSCIPGYGNLHGLFCFEELGVGPVSTKTTSSAKIQFIATNYADTDPFVANMAFFR